MTYFQTSSLALGLLICGVAVPARAQRAPAGLWQGALHLPNGELKLLFRFAPAAASGYSGTLTVPQQGIKDLTFTNVSVRADSVVARLDALRAQFRGRLSADGQQLGGVWQQGGALPLTMQRVAAGAEAAATAGPRRPQEPKPPFPYRSEDVAFSNSKAHVTLAGTLTLPPGKGPFPAAVLVTGSGPQDRDETLLGHKPFWVLADYLTRRGFAVLRYDDRGVGKSGGQFSAATTADFAADALAALAYVRSRPEVRPKQVALVGHSEGGLIAWQTAAQPAGGPDLVVALAGPGVAGIPLMLRQQQDIGRSQGLDTAQLGQLRRLNTALFAELARRPLSTPADSLRTPLLALARRTLPGLSAAQAQAQVLPFLTPWVRNFLASDPAADLRRVRCPVLALGGTKDLQVAADVNLPAIEQALRAGGNRDVTVRAMPGLNHLFQTAPTGAVAEYATLEETLAPAALQAVGDWLVAHTRR